MQVNICVSKAKNPPKIVQVSIVEPFATGIIDPPWPYTVAPGKAKKDENSKKGTLSGFIQNKDASQNKYPILSIEDLKSLPIGRLIGGYIFLWCVSPFLKQGIQLLEDWGFNYITTLCWAKYNLDRVRNGEEQGGYGGVGFWFLGNHELVLVGKKPGIPSIRTGCSSLFVEKKSRHTVKPPNVHKLCESLFPGPYVEIFARKNEMNRENWTLFGNGVDDDPDVSEPIGPDIREYLPTYLNKFYGE